MHLACSFGGIVHVDTDIRIISLCQELFNFELSSVQLERRCKKIRE